MPSISLTDNARQMLKDYYWPGNIRQLKNITEQISIIEQTREITSDILKLYLPANEVGLVPVSTGAANDQKMFNNEREILYQVLFDMKKDMNELKKVVHDLVSGNLKPADIVSSPVMASVDKTLTPMVVNPVEKTAPIPIKEDVHAISDADIIETPEYEEESLSLQDVEKDMIIKLLIAITGNARMRRRI